MLGDGGSYCFTSIDRENDEPIFGQHHIGRFPKSWGYPKSSKKQKKKNQHIETHGAIGIPILRNHNNISKIRPDGSLSETDYFEDPSLWISGGDGNEQKVPEANDKAPGKLSETHDC